MHWQFGVMNAPIKILDSGALINLHQKLKNQPRISKTRILDYRLKNSEFHKRFYWSPYRKVVEIYSSLWITGYQATNLRLFPKNAEYRIIELVKDSSYFLEIHWPRGHYRVVLTPSGQARG